MGGIEELVNTIKAHLRRKDLGKALSVSMLNQLVSSGTNFAISIYLVKALLPDEFGLYGIGFAVCIFFGGIGNALILVPMVVQIPHESPTARRNYAARMLAVLLIFSGAALCATAVATAVATATPWSPFVFEHINVITATVATSIAYLCKDFFLRLAYSERTEKWALIINLSIAIAIAIQLITLHSNKCNISAVTAIWVYGIGQLSGLVIGMTLTRVPLNTLHRVQLSKDIKDTWATGRWNLGSNITNGLRGQAYIIFSAATLGPAGVATLNAARLLVAPAIILLPAISQIALPRLASTGASDRAHMIRLSAVLGGALLVLSLLYSVGLLVALDPVAALVLGNAYKNIWPIVFAWVIFVSVQVVAVVATLTVQALRQFPILVIASIIGLSTTIIVIYPFYESLGITGVIYATALGELAMATTLIWKAIHKREATRN